VLVASGGCDAVSLWLRLTAAAVAVLGSAPSVAERSSTYTVCRPHTDASRSPARPAARHQCGPLTRKTLIRPESQPSCTRQSRHLARAWDLQETKEEETG